MKKFLLGIVVATAGAIGGAEAGVRMLGVMDFPLYEANNHIGYILKPNQAGKFMNSNDWVFNELSMGTAQPFKPSAKDDILLVGDSIVLGGNPYRQVDRLGPQLQNLTGATVWPISAGSWGMQNELQYISDHPEVIENVDRIIFLFNSGDFDLPSSWRSEFTHPRSQPTFALWYLFQRTVVTPEEPQLQSMLVPSKDPMAELQKFSVKWGKPFDVWIYPDKQENHDKSAWNRAFDGPLARLEATKIVNMTIHDGRTPFGLLDSDYRDDIHPTPKGTRKVAAAIAAALKQ